MFKFRVDKFRETFFTGFKRKRNGQVYGLIRYRDGSGSNPRRRKTLTRYHKSFK